MKNCLFCKLVKKEIPSLLVYEDDATVSFMELHPSAPGHVMVILKKHGNNILEYSQEDLGKIMASVQKVAAKLEKALKPDSISIGINHKERHGVPHLHIHLIPRWENDKGSIIQSIVKNVPKENREAIAEKIKKM
ncbi:MAG TPA: HIT family protein [Candidatus Sulfotelmatobacter sp.]|jgi:histidine triad (HIT) family protein|nr:HIT family protein [Candidatus Sulfotelmatobacter sp.]